MYWGEVAILLGHDRISSTTDLYAPLRPEYLVHVRDELDRIAREIETRVPGAFYHTFTTQELARAAA